MRQARAGVGPLVDAGVEVPGGLGGTAPRPRFRDEFELLVVELGERALVLAAVDHDLLTLEGRVEIRDDPHAPRLAPSQRLRRRPVLSPRAERARVELFVGLVRDAAAA